METALSRSFDSGSDDAFDGDDDDNEGSEVRKLESSKGRDDEEDFFSHKSIQQRLKELAFSLLFLMVHGNKSHHIFDFFGIVIEDFQLFIFFVGSDVYMGFELPPGLRNLAGGVDHNHMQMSVYTPMLILSAIGVLFMVANVMFVAYGVITGHQRLIWPIRTLRVCAKTLSTVCFLPIFECLVSVVACNRVHDGTADDVDNLNNLSCSSPGRQAKLAVACVALLFYIPISVSVTSVFYEFNPALKGPANKSHGRVDTIYLLLKASTIIVYKFLPDSAYLAKLAFAILVCLAMFCCTNYFYPNYDIRINQERAGVYLAAFSSGLVVFLGSCYYANTGMVANYGVLVCLLLALVAGFLLGFWLTGLRYQRIQKIVESRMEALSSGLTVDEADYLVFDSWPCVEIAARVFTAHMDERRTSFKLENIAKLRAIFNRGLHEFPEEPMIRIQYSYYLFILSRNDIETTSLMAKVREAPLDVQFRIYYFNQISDQNKEANFLGLNVKLDVASYADYQKTDKDAKLNHYLAVQEMKHLYKLIRDKDFKLEDLSAVTVRLYMHAQRAQEAYVKLASQFPKSKSIMRYFARFCYDVTKDQIRGDNLTYYADELENRRETDDRKKLQPMQPDTRIDTSASDVGRSDTGSSYVTRRAVHVAQRQREARMRSRRLQVNLLFIFKTVGILALWVANFYVVLNLLQISQSSLTRLTWQADRKIYIATSFLRIRQMEAAKNEAEYEVTRSKFQEEMRNLSYIFREIFLNREESDSLENAYDTQNMFTMYFSGYPTVPILIPINTSVFHYTEAVAASGTVVANLSWDTFKDRPSYNNDVRFVLDNYSGAQTIFSLPMQAFLHREWSKTSAAIKTVYILMGCQLFINIVLAIIVDLLFGRFHKGQQAILEVFRHIPRDVLKEELDSLEESDGSDFFPQSIVKFAEKMSRTESTQFSRKNFRIFLIVATVCLVALTAVTAYLNVGVFKSVAESFSVLDMGSTIKEYLARSVVLAQEFNGNDTITWSSKKVLADNYQTAFLTMFKAFEGIVFGDSDHEPPTQSYNHFAPSVVQLLNYEKCLPFNTSLCSPTGRVWNETLAYTYDIVSGGLFQLTHYFLKFHVGILTSASIGVPIDPTSVDTMLKFLEPDLLDGWTQFRIRMIDYVADVHEKSVNLNYVLFSFFLALLITSFAIELYVVRKLLDNYRFTEHGIYGILGSLPSHARRIHAIAALLKLTGEADAEMGAETLNNGPAGPTASPKTERSPSARRSTIKPGDITRSPSRRRVVLRTAEIPEITIDNHADSHPAAEKEGGSMEEKEGSLRAE